MQKTSRLSLCAGVKACTSFGLYGNIPKSFLRILQVVVLEVSVVDAKEDMDDDGISLTALSITGIFSFDFLGLPVLFSTPTVPCFLNLPITLRICVSDGESCRPVLKETLKYLRILAMLPNFPYCRTIHVICSVVKGGILIFYASFLMHVGPISIE